VSDFETKIQYVSIIVLVSPLLRMCKMLSLKKSQISIKSKFRHISDSKKHSQKYNKFDQSLWWAKHERLKRDKIAIGGFGYLIMMFIIIYGNMVMRSVIEEKLIVLLKLLFSVKPFTNDR
jgi:ABC-2 type transport system permease protein